jgi:hypothetical protein
VIGAVDIAAVSGLLALALVAGVIAFLVRHWPPATAAAAAPSGREPAAETLS